MEMIFGILAFIFGVFLAWITTRKKNMQLKIYLIHPVKDITEEEKEALDKYVEDLELNKGYEVHYPIRDVNQDQRGVCICEEHLEAMIDCDEVHLAWTEKSRGSIWDLGMAYGLEKPLKIVPGFYPQSKEHKAYENVLLEWAEEVEPNILP